jgi:hypothetical protein
LCPRKLIRVRFALAAEVLERIKTVQ